MIVPAFSASPAIALRPHYPASVIALLLCALLCAVQASAATREDARALAGIGTDLQGLRLDQPLAVDDVRASATGVLHPSLAGSRGPQEVVIRLATPAVGKMRDALPGERLGRKYQIQGEQSDFLARWQSKLPSMRVVARTQLVLNAVFVEVDAAELAAIALDPMVVRIAPVGRYELNLSETVPYIGGTAVQAGGNDGSGVTVAVLDSGIDYTHAKLGGPGTIAAYEAAYGVGPGDPANTTADGLFPTARVVAGYDFVGEQWPFGPLLPDEDPIDFQGHGSHVADIIGGSNGVAPGVDLVAVKVCSAVSTSCSGVALIQGMEFAVDPDGDGDADDAVDVINMSLGSNYGQPFDDDLSQAVENATGLGVLTVASAGNSSDKPYISGTPAAAASAISVAQTQVPSAALQLIGVNDISVPAVFQPWSTPLVGAVTGPVQYGDGAGGNLDGCAPFAPGSLTGLVVLVDRGACNFTLKISNISQADGSAGIIGLVAPGAPFSGGDGGDRPIDIPGYMVDQAASLAIQARVSQVASIDPANQLPLVMQIVGSSSRGPRNGDNAIKPDIGAPGASVSLEVGTGTGETAFGGTSGAAPMVSGAAALVLAAYADDDDGPGMHAGKGKKSKGKKGKGRKHRAQDLSPALVKALLTTNAETLIDTDPFTGLAPITRIGGGEVRVDRALGTGVAAFDHDTLQGSLSFGLVDATKPTTKVERRLEVLNLSDHPVDYVLTPTYRYADDAASGAVEIEVQPDHLQLQPGQQKNVKVELTILGDLLPGNFMNSGSQGANGAALTANEFDGYINLAGGDHELNVAWHVLPRKAASIKDKKAKIPDGGGIVELDNKGVGTAQINSYSLLAVSGDLLEGDAGAQNPTPDLRAVGINTIPVPAGFCSADASFIWEFAVNTWEPQTHLLPVIHIVELDTSGDGVPDWLVLNSDVTGPFGFADGRQLTWSVNLTAGTAQAFFFAEHAMNTGNTVLRICGEQVGLNASNFFHPVGMAVEAFDFYYGGRGDRIDGLTVAPLGERYFGIPEDIAGDTKGSIEVVDFGATPGLTEELGLLLLTNGDRGTGARGGAELKRETVLVRAKGADLSPLKEEEK
ncbi:MAG TPA: S8 family serine peptidase [Pseudomonadales bacterium]|nr:S8 family serine peptidase [Pseudomonadales bacterium]